MNEDYGKEWIKSYAEERNELAGEVIVNEIRESESEYDGKMFKRAVYDGGFSKGKIIDQEKILSDLMSLSEDPSLEKKVIVEWETTYPKIVSKVEGYDFPQILSTGISSFRYGNHPNRIKNIKLSLFSLNGVVVDPGEELSFNRVTGWVTPRKGYTKTKIIDQGRVTEGLG